MYTLANLRDDELVNAKKFLIIALFWLRELLLRLVAPMLGRSVWVGWCDEWELPGIGIYTTIKEAGN